MISEKDIKFFRKSEMWNKEAENFVRKLNFSSPYHNLWSCIYSDPKPVSGCLLLTFDGIIVLFHLFTLKSKRRKGYARIVVKNAIEALNRTPNHILLARSIIDSNASKLFKSMGFVSNHHIDHTRTIVWQYFRE